MRHVLVLVAALLLVPSALALSCGSSITNDTFLTDDIMGCPATGIYIGASGVTLDCQGHRIDGVDASGSAGVWVQGASGITVRDCVITDFENGIYLQDGPAYAGGLIEGNIISSVVTGIKQRFYRGVRIHDNTIGNLSYCGIELAFSSGENDISANTFTNTHTPIYGFGSSGENNVTDNRARKSTYGIHFYSGSGYNIIERNIVADSKYAGLTLESSPVITDHNVVRNNTFSNAQVGVKLMTSHDNIIEGNTMLHTGNGLLMYHNDWGGGDALRNIVSSNLIVGSSIGIQVANGFNNTFAGNTVTTGSPIRVSKCGNTFIANIGPGGLPLLYAEQAVFMSGGAFSQVVLCDADGSVIENMSIGPGTSGLYALYLDDAVIRGVHSSGNSYGAYFRNSSNITIADSVFMSNAYEGVLLSGVRASVVAGNTFVNNTMAIELASSVGNILWGNDVRGTTFYLAYEDEDSNGNAWDLGDIGNYWEDFVTNPGYPLTYIVPGPGDGVDYRPLNDRDGDGYPSWNDCDDQSGAINPGAAEKCNQVDDDCDGLVDELYCLPFKPRPKFTQA
ncbi:MAG: right-handed parallel beta-helix repeat-containing protein [Nanoarchaeota archaeon]